MGKMKAVTAMTDITGFGLLGHLIEMAEGSGLSARLDFEKVPVYPNLQRYLDAFIYPDMTTKNFSAYASKVNTLSAKQLFTLCDPQTSGGLLVAVKESAQEEFESLCFAHGLSGIADHPIGRMVGRGTHVVEVV